MNRNRTPAALGNRRVRYRKRFTEAVAVAMVQTSPRTCIAVSACTRGGRAYVRLQSFYRPRESRTGGWRLGNLLVLPVGSARALLPLLEQAADRAEGLPSALPGNSPDS